MRSKVGRTGIGLALIKCLVEAMRGTLPITSESGIGTTVEVGVPKARRIDRSGLPEKIFRQFRDIGRRHELGDELQ